MHVVLDLWRWSLIYGGSTVLLYALCFLFLDSVEIIGQDLLSEDQGKFINGAIMTAVCHWFLMYSSIDYLINADKWIELLKQHTASD